MLGDLATSQDLKPKVWPNMTDSGENWESRETWKARIKKWRKGVDIEANKEELDEFVQTKVFEYKLDKRSDFNLWDLFKDDFKDFTAKTFREINCKEL